MATIAREEQEKVAVWSSPITLGMILFLISESFLFGALFWTYYYLRGYTPGWPTEQPPALLAGINTLFLLSSSVTVWWAGQSIRKGNVRGLAIGLAATICLGSIFLGVTLWEWTHEVFRPWTSAYGSIFFTLTGFHGLHVLAGVVLMIALLIRTLRNRFSKADFVPVEVGSLYWHFVDFVWLWVFGTIFFIR